MAFNYLGSPFLSGTEEIDKPDFTQFELWGVYFSAHWCGPCRRFTPFLSAFYKQKRLVEKKQFEIVFVSQDSNEQEFQNYFSEMPWISIPFTETFRMRLMTAICKPTSIPSLYIFDSKGAIVSKDGVRDLGKMGDDAYAHWLEESKQ